jgi:hypothetical protein
VRSVFAAATAARFLSQSSRGPAAWQAHSCGAAHRAYAARPALHTTPAHVQISEKISSLASHYLPVLRQSRPIRTKDAVFGIQPNISKKDLDPASIELSRNMIICLDQIVQDAHIGLNFGENLSLFLLIFV